MPTSKPRVQVTLSQDVYDSIKRYSDVSGMSMSGFISKVLEQATPSLNALIEVVEISNRMSSEARESFLSGASDVEGDIGSIFRKISGLRDDFKDDVESSNPLAINKGVRFSKNSSTKTSKNNKNIYLASSSEGGK